MPCFSPNQILYDDFVDIFVMHTKSLQKTTWWNCKQRILLLNSLFSIISVFMLEGCDSSWALGVCTLYWCHTTRQTQTCGKSVLILKDCKSLLDLVLISANLTSGRDYENTETKVISILLTEHLHPQTHSISSG